jgi:hypothetical protein
VLVAPDKGTRATPKRWLRSGRASWMRSVLATEHGQQRYRKRKQTVEPLFGDTKHNYQLVHLLLVPVAGIGRHCLGPLADPDPFELRKRGGDHRVEL